MPKHLNMLITKILGVLLVASGPLNSYKCSNDQLRGHTSEFRRQYGGSTAAVRRQYGGSTAEMYSDNTYIRILIQLFHDFDD